MAHKKLKLRSKSCDKGIRFNFNIEVLFLQIVHTTVLRTLGINPALENLGRRGDDNIIFHNAEIVKRIAVEISRLHRDLSHISVITVADNGQCRN